MTVVTSAIVQPSLPIAQSCSLDAIGPGEQDRRTRTEGDREAKNLPFFA